MVQPISKTRFIRMLSLLFVGLVGISCATIKPILAPRVAQPDTPVARNFTSFSTSLRCLDEMLLRANKPRILISSTGIPDFTKKISVGGDDMLVNAINQMNQKSRAYIFVDQALERDNGQIVYHTRPEDVTQPRLYIRGSISQLDSEVVDDSGTLSIDATDAPNPFTIKDGPLGKSKNSAGRKLSVVSVDMHLVSWPSKTVIAGASIANSMVVTGDAWGVGASGLIRLTGYDVALKMERVESQGQAVRNLIELGTMELLGRHARVPYWECLQLRTTNEKVTEKIEKEFVATPHNIKILDVQVYLRRLGYFDGPQTGVLDRKTRAAISKFQADEDLIATGDLDFDAFERLKERALGKPVLVERPFVGSTLNPPSTDLPTGLVKLSAGNRNLSRAPSSLRLIPSQSSYAIGDIFAGALTASHDGFLACFHQSGFGPITQILPVKPNSRLKVTLGTTVKVPSPDSQFDIKFESAENDEAIMCFLDQSEKPVSLSIASASSSLGAISARNFDSLISAYRRRSKGVVWQEIRHRAE